MFASLVKPDSHYKVDGLFKCEVLKCFAGILLLLQLFFNH